MYACACVYVHVTYSGGDTRKGKNKSEKVAVDKESVDEQSSKRKVVNPSGCDGVYLCMYTLFLHLYTCIYICMRNMYNIYVCMYIHMKST